MNASVKLDQQPALALQRFARERQVLVVSLLFVLLMSAQTVCYLVLGTDRLARGLSALVLALQSLLAISCAWIAFRRARGLPALFWFLFSVTLVILLIPSVIFAAETCFHQFTLSDSTWRLLYCIYGAPIMMMFFLPETRPAGQLRWEVFLDFFQVAIVVALVYSTFFFLPLQTMAPDDALVRSVLISILHTFFLLLAAVMRRRFARSADTRNLFSRLALFLAVCAGATFIGDWINQHHYSTAAAWFDLGWALPQVAAAFVAISWRPSAEPSPVAQSAKFLNFLGTNLVLVAMLSSMYLLMGRWKAAYGETITHFAVGASLIAFTLRLALTQFHQQREIADRQAAQAQLTVANDRVTALLDDAHRQTQEITQVSELGSLLQACTTQKEAFRLIPDRLRRILPDVSGCISLLSSSKSRAESVAEWGPCPPADQIFAPEECWALRRGSAHVHCGGASALKCPHLLGEGDAICIPLFANGQAIGTLALQDNALPGSADDAALSSASAWRRQLATSVADHISVAIANLNLRDALRLQAIRDPLTGLYNRRYMEEFLEREIRRAQRRSRPVAVMMLDLDHFKRYNDTFGHSAGDQALAVVGETLLRSVRAEDVACRYGGEEFVVVLPECSLRQAVARAEDIRERLRDRRAPRDGHSRDPITVSAGVAGFDETTDQANLLLKFADDALYQAKHAGRNCVVAAKPAGTSPPASDLEPPEKAKAASFPAT